MDNRTFHGLIVSSDKESGRRVLILSRPERANALGSELAEGLLHWVKLSSQDGCRTLIIRSDGRHFCSGFDFTGFESESVEQLLGRFVHIELLLRGLRRAPFVSFALVNGAAFGAGADLAAACTYRLGTSAARFRFPGFQFGVALGTRHLAALIGMQGARDILLRNQLVPAEAAHRLGLLTHLVEASELSDAADALASEVGALEGRAIDQILDLTRAGEDERDMDELVRSLTHSGLHDRIAHYRASQEGGRPTNVDRTSITRSPVSGQAADVG